MQAVIAPWCWMAVRDDITGGTVQAGKLADLRRPAGRLGRSANRRRQQGLVWGRADVVIACEGHCA